MVSRFLARFVILHSGGLSQATAIGIEPQSISDHETTNIKIHRPLNKPGGQIRLLEFIPCGDGSELCCKLSTWDLELAPNYSAISYTWGSEADSKIITINNERYRVRANCYHALWQARNATNMAYLWIDAICINQQDLDEKTLQVQMMYEIFAQAQEVLGCVGPHADQSEMLTEVAKDLTRVNVRSIAELGKSFDLNPEIEDWALAQEPETVDHIWQAIVLFAGRTYWTRLWIVQEIFAAIHARKGNHNLRILCGESCLSWNDVTLLMWMAEICTIDIRHQHFKRLSPTMQHSPLYEYITIRMEGMTIYKAFTQYGSHECSDPRDHLFALLSIIDWPKSEQASPKVDYRKSVLEIAIQLLPFLNTFSIRHMLQAFKLQADSWVIARILDHRRPFRLRRVAGTLESNGEEMDVLLETAGAYKRDNSASTGGLGLWTGWSEITRDHNDCMTADLDLSDSRSKKGDLRWVFFPEDLHKLHTKGLSENLCNKNVRPLQTPSFRKKLNTWMSLVMLKLGRGNSHANTIRPKEMVVMMKDDNVAALLCSQARMGDLLLGLNNDYLEGTQAEEVLLIVRRNELGDFDVIGQGFTVNGFRLRHERDQPSMFDMANPRLPYSISLRPVDLILFLCQDSTDGMTYNRWNRALRLVTSVTPQLPVSILGDSLDMQLEQPT